jgi:hypothetical protein
VSATRASEREHALEERSTDAAADARPVLAAASCDANSVGGGADLLQAIATMSPDAVRLAHRACVWHPALLRAAESGGFVLVVDCAWEAPDEETLELMTVRDSASGNEVPVPPGLGVLANLLRASCTPAGEAALRLGADGLRLTCSPGRAL